MSVWDKRAGVTIIWIQPVRAKPGYICRTEEGKTSALKGWGGNQSGREATVASLTGVEDCPSVSLKFRTDKAITWHQAEMTVTRPINPFGKCCKGEFVIIDSEGSSSFSR